MSPIGVVLALVAGVLAGARGLAARLDELAHAPATEADRVVRWRGETCTPRTCLVDDTTSCCVYLAHTIPGRLADLAAPPPDPVPPTLTRADVTSGMIAVRGRVDGCRDQYPARGRVAVRVGVSPDGAVASAAVAPSSGDEAFDACIATAVGAARFPRSEK